MESKTEDTMWLSIRNCITKRCPQLSCILFWPIYRENNQWSSWIMRILITTQWLQICICTRRFHNSNIPQPHHRLHQGLEKKDPVQITRISSQLQALERKEHQAKTQIHKPGIGLLYSVAEIFWEVRGSLMLKTFRPKCCCRERLNKKSKGIHLFRFAVWIFPPAVKSELVSNTLAPWPNSMGCPPGNIWTRRLFPYSWTHWQHWQKKGHPTPLTTWQVNTKSEKSFKNAH